MFCVVLFLIVNMSFFTESNIYRNDNYNILMNLTKQTYQGSIYESTHIFVVLRNKKFVVKLLNYQAIQMHCGIPNSHKFPATFKISKEAGVTNTVVEFSQATDDMTGTWECTIERVDPAVPLTITFKVRVKDSYDERIKIKIGEEDQTLTLTNSSELKYDEVSTYQYRNGEAVDLVCSNKRSDGQIYLRYYNAIGKMLIKTGKISKSNDNNENIMFQKTLYNTHDNHKIDCTYVTAKDQLEFTSRIIFRLSNAPSETDFRIIINTVQLVPQQKSGKTKYNFMCFPEEIFTVTCELLKDDHLLTLYILDGQTYKPLEDVVEHEGTGNKTKTLTIKCTSVKDSIACAAFNGTNELKLKAKIFLKNREYPKLRISGLNKMDVINQYTNTSKDWVIDYVFRAGHVLNITCISSLEANLRIYELIHPSSDFSLQSSPPAEPVDNVLSFIKGWVTKACHTLRRYASRMQNYSREAKTISQTFSLEDRHHKSRIICRDGNTETDYNRKVTINLYRYTFVSDAGSSRGTSSTPSLPSDPSGDSSEQAPLDPSLDYDNPVTPPTDVTGTPDSRLNKKVLIGSVLAVFALILTALTTVCSVIFYRRHKRARMQQSDENLLHQSDTPIPPYPPQWNSRAEDNGNNIEYMVHNSMYDQGPNLHESPEYAYVDVVDHLKKHNNSRTNSADTHAVQNDYHDIRSPNYSNVNPNTESLQDKHIYDYVYAQVRK